MYEGLHVLQDFISLYRENINFQDFSKIKVLLLFPLRDVKTSLKNHELSAVNEVETLRFKTRPSRLLYDFLLQSYSS